MDENRASAAADESLEGPSGVPKGGGRSWLRRWSRDGGEQVHHPPWCI